jgi:hypothetical protein
MGLIMLVIGITLKGPDDPWCAERNSRTPLNGKIDAIS